MNDIEKGRAAIGKENAKKVMPLIGRLLDTWDEIPNDVKFDPELEKLANGLLT